MRMHGYFYGIYNLFAAITIVLVDIAREAFRYGA